jgi:hypothetical protein
MPIAALPLPAVAFVIAAFAFISAYRHGNARASLPLTLHNCAPWLARFFLKKP